MDKITHEIRLSNWKAVIEQCSLRPEGQTVKQWLADNGINEKTYYYWQRRIRGFRADKSASASRKPGTGVCFIC